MSGVYLMTFVLGAMVGAMTLLIYRTARRYADERLREQQLADAHVARYRAEHRQDPL